MNIVYQAVISKLETLTEDNEKKKISFCYFDTKFLFSDQSFDFKNSTNECLGIRSI